MKLNQLIFFTVSLFSVAAHSADQIATSYPPVIQGRANSVAIDGAGNQFVAGDIFFTGDFNPGPGDDTKTVLGVRNGYLTRFNADGTYAWTVTFGGSGDDSATNLAIANGVVYVTGVLRSSDAGFGGSGTIMTSGNDDGYVFAVDSTTGAPVLAFGGDGVVTFAGANNERASGVAVANGVVYVCGDTFSGDFGVNALSTTPVMFVDSFVVALDSATGAPVTSFSGDGIQLVGGSGQDSCEGIAISGNNIYISGFFASTDMGIGGLGTATALGAADAYVAVLDVATGAAVTAFSTDGIQTFGGNGFDTGVGVQVSGTTVYLMGNFDSTDAGIGGAGTLATKGLLDAFIVALDATSGAPVTTFGTNGIQVMGGTDNENGERMAVSNGVVYGVGVFASTNFGIGAATGTVTVAGLDDAFIVALDAVTGQPITAFSTDGIEIFGGGMGDYGYDVAVGNGGVYMTGEFESANAGVGGVGTFNSLNFPGFLLKLNAVNGTSAIPNVGQNLPATVNPLNKISVKILTSTGGVITLEIDVSSVNRAPTSVSTDFEDIPGRGAVVDGLRPSHFYISRGVYIATSTASDVPTGEFRGKMRKTLAISARETGDSGALPAAQSSELKFVSLKGKFLFTKDTPDSVTYNGTIVLPPGFDIAKADGNELSFGVGNITDTLTILPKGKAALPSVSGRIKKAKVKYPRLPKGTTVTVGGEVATIQITYSTDNMDSRGFDTEGITTVLAPEEAGLRKVQRKIQVAAVFGGVAYQSEAPVDFALSKKADAGIISGRGAR